ncbi:hypothetical protein HN615_13965 [Candidatus Woesearchaeota archaeon]|jgi:hypothetical protein|nr:hypothetical protein [Candidatus Woesearchaeota archaeon]|tara:strand:+ start:1558 stop:1731 length:174 start_codon:yes stop_codon:yes gene_type:complete
MRYKDRVEMDLDIIERHLGRCKDAIDANNLAEVANQLVQVESKVDNIRNMIELEVDG